MRKYILLGNKIVCNNDSVVEVFWLVGLVWLLLCCSPRVKDK